MGSFDILQRAVSTDPEIFADFFNAFVFHGRQVITKNDLEDVAPDVMFNDETGQVRESRRDSIKRWISGNMLLAFLAVESQSAVDYSMPARVMTYDALTYNQQLKTSVKCRPVITLTLYYGEKPWTAPTSLADQVVFPPRMREEIMPFFNDYKINLIDFTRLPRAEIQKLTTDLRFLSTYIHNTRNPDDELPLPSVKNLELADQFIRKCLNLSDEVVVPMTSLKKENMTMAEITNLYMEPYRLRFLQEGMLAGIEKGREEGIEKGREEGREAERKAAERRMAKERREAARNLAQHGVKAEDIAEAFKIDVAIVRRWIK